MLSFLPAFYQLKFFYTYIYIYIYIVISDVFWLPLVIKSATFIMFSNINSICVRMSNRPPEQPNKRSIDAIVAEIDVKYRKTTEREQRDL